MGTPSVAVLVAIAAVAGGAIGGAVAWGVSAAGSPSRSGMKGNPSASESDDRLSAIERRLAAIERRSAFRTARPPGEDGAATPRPAAPRTAGAEPSPAREVATIDDPVFEAAVRDVVQRVGEEREVEEKLERDEQRRAAAETWTSELSTRLSLRPEQKTKLETLAKEFFERVREAFAGDGGVRPPREERRERMRSLRTEAEERIGAVLDAKQMDEYKKLDEDFRLGAPRFRARR